MQLDDKIGVIRLHFGCRISTLLLSIRPCSRRTAICSWSFVKVGRFVRGQSNCMTRLAQVSVLGYWCDCVVHMVLHSDKSCSSLIVCEAGTARHYGTIGPTATLMQPDDRTSCASVFELVYSADSVSHSAKTVPVCLTAKHLSHH